MTFSKTGFLPQTVQISVGEPAERSLFSKSAAPALMPNPVRVSLQQAAATDAAAGSYTARRGIMRGVCFYPEIDTF